MIIISMSLDGVHWTKLAYWNKNQTQEASDQLDRFIRLNPNAAYKLDIL